MTETHDRTISLASLPNFRSLDGLPVAGGTVAPGLIFRSATLAGVTDSDGEAVRGLGIRRVIDFRTDAERASAPDRLPAGFEQIALDVLGDHAAGLAASMNQLGAIGHTPDDPVTPEELARVIEGAQQVLGDGRGGEMLRESNREIVRSKTALAAYRAFFRGLAAEDFVPTLFHCTTGKDRTGWAAAALLALLGASSDTVMADYLQTNVDILPMIEPMIERASAVGIDPGLLTPVLTVHESYLEAAFDEAVARYGSIDGYFAAGLGLADEDVAAIRARFVEVS